MTVHHPLLVLARQAIRAELEGRRADPARLAANPPQGCFVSLKLRQRLRGCMGTIFPVTSSLEAEVAANAVAAALRDPRFEPLRLAELGATHISIDLLSPTEPVASPEALDPACYGVVVRAGKRSGVLLPDLPGVTTARKQIAICREKAGIRDEEPVTLERFTVERLVE